MLRTTARPNARRSLLVALVCLVTVGSACGSRAEGEARGAAFADLGELAEDVTLDALECAHESGVEEAHLTAEGGIVGGVGEEANVVSDCFAEVLEQPEYAVFSDDSPEVARATYDGLVVIHECMVREGFSLASAAPTLDEWMQSGRSWSPYDELVRDRDLIELDAATEACEPN